MLRMTEFIHTNLDLTRNEEMKVKIAGTLFLIITALVIGVFFLFWGIKGAVETGAVSRDYEITEGYL